MSQIEKYGSEESEAQPQPKQNETKKGTDQSSESLDQAEIAPETSGGMNRRRFLKILGIGTAAVAAGEVSRRFVGNAVEESERSYKYYEARKASEKQKADYFEYEGIRVREAEGSEEAFGGFIVPWLGEQGLRGECYIATKWKEERGERRDQYGKSFGLEATVDIPQISLTWKKSVANTTGLPNDAKFDDGDLIQKLVYQFENDPRVLEKLKGFSEKRSS